MKIRKIVLTDEPLVSSWLAQDELHQQLGLSFGNLLEPQTEPYLVSDDSNVPFIAIRLHLSLRAAMQFDPSQPYKSAKYAPEVIDWMKRAGKLAGAKELIIRPGGKAVNFADRLGFEDFIGKYMEIE